MLLLVALLDNGLHVLAKVLYKFLLGIAHHSGILGGHADVLQVIGPWENRDPREPTDSGYKGELDVFIKTFERSEEVLEESTIAVCHFWVM